MPPGAGQPVWEAIGIRKRDGRDKHGRDVARILAEEV
jgi:hypothetical protein